MRKLPLPTRIFLSVEADGRMEAEALREALASLLRECGCQPVPPSADATAPSPPDDALKERILACDGWIHFVRVTGPNPEGAIPEGARPYLATAAGGPGTAVFRLANPQTEAAAGSAAEEPREPGLREEAFASEEELFAAARDFATGLRLAKEGPTARAVPRVRIAAIALAASVAVVMALAAALFPGWLANRHGGPQHGSPWPWSSTSQPSPHSPDPPDPPLSAEEAQTGEEAAEAALRSALESAADGEARLEPLSRLAVLLHSQGRLDEAEPSYREALALGAETLGPDHPAVLSLENNLAALLRALGRYGEAEPILRGLVAHRETRLGRTHPDTLGSIHNLAHVLQSAGRHEEAVALYREVSALGAVLHGAEHPDTLAAKHNLASALRATGEWVEAESLALAVLAARRRVFGAAHPATLASLHNLAELRHAQGRLEEAAPLFREAYEGFRAARGEEDPATRRVKAHWESCLEELAGRE